jgi:5-methylcytosine-specific restriction endonuclease McrA
VDHQIAETELIPRKEAKLRFRDQILLAWDWACAYCKEPLGRSATLDHVVPKVKGGATERQNLVACCLACNSFKSGHDWLEWYRTQPFHSKLQEQAIAEWLEQANS